jgi:hypothetical protein
MSSRDGLVRCKFPGLRTVVATLMTLVASALDETHETALAAGTSSDGPGATASGRRVDLLQAPGGVLFSVR